MSDHENLDTVKRLYAAFGSGDMPGLLASLDPNIDWSVLVTAPWTGEGRGLAHVQGFPRSSGRMPRSRSSSPGASWPTAIPSSCSAMRRDGQQLALAEFRGRPFALHFWASWCGVCSAMRPNLRSIAKEQRVISVASRSGDDTAVRGFVVQHALDAPVIADTSGAIAKSYGVRAFPTTFFVDARGVIRHVEVGYTTELGLRLRLWSAGL